MGQHAPYFGLIIFDFHGENLAKNSHMELESPIPSEKSRIHFRLQSKECLFLFIPAGASNKILTSQFYGQQYQTTSDSCDVSVVVCKNHLTIKGFKGDAPSSVAQFFLISCVDKYVSKLFLKYVKQPRTNWVSL